MSSGSTVNNNLGKDVITPDSNNHDIDAFLKSVCTLLHSWCAHIESEHLSCKPFLSPSSNEIENAQKVVSSCCAHAVQASQGLSAIIGLLRTDPAKIASDAAEGIEIDLPLGIEWEEDISIDDQLDPTFISFLSACVSPPLNCLKSPCTIVPELVCSDFHDALGYLTEFASRNPFELLKLHYTLLHLRLTLSARHSGDISGDETSQNSLIRQLLRQVAPDMIVDDNVKNFLTYASYSIIGCNFVNKDHDNGISFLSFCIDNVFQDEHEPVFRPIAISVEYIESESLFYYYPNKGSHRETNKKLVFTKKKNPDSFKSHFKVNAASNAANYHEACKHTETHIAENFISYISDRMAEARQRGCQPIVEISSDQYFPMSLELITKEYFGADCRMLADYAPIVSRLKETNTDDRSLLLGRDKGNLPSAIFISRPTDDDDDSILTRKEINRLIAEFEIDRASKEIACSPLDIEPYISARHGLNVDIDDTIELSTYTNKGARIVHFCGHNGKNWYSRVKGQLVSGNLIQVEKPILYFLNICGSDDRKPRRNGGNYFSEVSDFIGQTSKGNCAIIASTLPIKADVAMEFSVSFYRHFIHGNKTVARSIHCAREQLRQLYGDDVFPFWNAYTVIGNHNIRYRPTGKLKRL